MPADPEHSPRLPRASVFVPWILATACLLAAGWTAARYIVLESENRTLAQREALLLVTLRSAQTRLDAEQIVGDRVVTELQKSDAAARMVAPLISANGQSSPIGALTWSTGRPDGLLVTEALPATSGGEHYELWSVAPKRTRIASFTVAADGRARVAFDLAEPLPPQAEFLVYRASGSASSARPDVVLRSASR